MRDTKRETDRLKGKKKRTNISVSIFFFCFSENSYHVIENGPVKDQRSDTFQVNNLVGHGNSESGLCFV